MHAALRMRDELGRLQVAWAARGWPRVDIRCGVHTATVFVGNLSFETTEAEVRELFEPCGRIVELRVPRERGGDGGGGERIRGIAFVQFSSDAGVVQALHMDRELVGGRPIKVKRSEVGGNTGGGHGERRPHGGNDPGGEPKRARYAS